MSEFELIKMCVDGCCDILRSLMRKDADAKTMFRKMKKIGELGLTECGDEPVEEDR